MTESKVISFLKNRKTNMSMTTYNPNGFDQMQTNDGFKRHCAEKDN